MGVGRFLHVSDDQLSGISHNQHHQQHSKQDEEADYSTQELPALYTLLREQSLRIRVLEEQLIAERAEHARQIQRVEYAYATEIERLREVEAYANRLYEQQSRRELDTMEVHDQDSTAGTPYSANSRSHMNSLRRSSSSGHPSVLNQSTASNSATNLDTGREYVSMEFDRAYEGVVSASIGGGWDQQQQQQRNRSMLQESPETSKHHLIHISSPPPRLPGKTSPIPMAAGAAKNAGHRRPGLNIPGKIQLPGHNHNASMLGRSFSQQSQRWVNDSMSQSQDDFLPPGHVAMNASASVSANGVPSAALRESSDKDDSDFLAYLSAFQEEIRHPSNPFKAA